MRGVIVSLFVILCVNFVQCANILGIWFSAERKHFVLGETLFIELAKRGHNVTMASPFYSSKTTANYTNIVINGFEESEDFKKNIYMKRMNKLPVVIDRIFRRTRRQTEITLANFDVKSLIKDGTSFNLIITDWFFNFAVLYYGKMLNVPVIALSYQGADNVGTILSGVSSEPSYLAALGSHSPSDMDIVQRACNGMLYSAVNMFARRFMSYHSQLIEKYFNDTMSRKEMIKTLALVLSNGHYSFESPRPYVPDIIPIGGFHIPPPETLPKFYKSFLDAAFEGAIYCSLVSESSQPSLSKNTVEMLMRSFGEMREMVIFEWNHYEIINKPDNVLVCYWCPQNDILAHPNVNIFVTHGDVLSTIQAIFHAVPVLGIPFYEDERINMVSAVRQGYARHLNLDNLNEETFSVAIYDLILDPNFEVRIRKLSRLLRDQPMPPMDTAVFWIEHVIRHGGASHLKTRRSYMPWYSYYMIDVWLILSFLAIGCIVILSIAIADMISVVSPPHLFVVSFLVATSVFILDTHLFIFRFLEDFIE